MTGNTIYSKNIVIGSNKYPNCDLLTIFDQISIDLKQRMKSKKKNPSLISLERHPVHSSSKKHSYKHSRKPTSQPPQLHQLINISFGKSKQLLENQSYINCIDSLVFGHSCKESVFAQEVFIETRSKEFMNSYYVLSKFQSTNDSENIQTNLVQTIRKNQQHEPSFSFIPHFDHKIQPIIQKHTQKMKNYHKKIKIQQQISAIDYPFKKPEKQLPTLSIKQSTKSGKYKPGQNSPVSPNPYQSFELMALADCIKKMFQKQNTTKIQSISRIVENSWLKVDRNQDISPPIDCDQSLIYPIINSKVLQHGKWSEPEEMYGLVDIKRRYEESRHLPLQSKMSDPKRFGHKRNPTEIPFTKEYYHKDPMTPRNNPARSVFGSAKNMPIDSQRKQSKDPYHLKFSKHKKQSSKMSQQSKENHKELQRKVICGRSQVKSKSRSREKNTFKSPFLKKH